VSKLPQFVTAGPGRRIPPLRKLLLLVAGVALMGGTLAACVGGPPPPPPTDPKDVLVVGDSVAFSFGCVLGDALPGVPAGGCPASPDYSAKNLSVGACTIYGVTVSLYNGGSASAPNCDTVPAPPDNRTWVQAADHYVPKVVVINTGGWEIVDRWLSFTAVPDSQWGGSTSGQAYENAAVYYSSALYNAINEFRARGAQVLVANQPHLNPLQPVPPPNEVPAGLECSWWEPYPNNPPTAQPNGEPNGLTCPGAWRSPTGNTSYRPSKTKIDQLNTIINQVKTQWFGSDPNVRIFNFEKHFNQPGTDAYTSHICPPPYDSTVVAENRPDLRPGSPTFGQMVWQCDIQGDGALNDVNAILARAPDNGHLSVAGQEDILRPYLETCVRGLLGLANGNVNDCA
jgi:hypothetical protein